MKVKKEVFESLRLDLQEFVPQEYCDGCWKLECLGNGNGRYITSDKKGNHGNTLVNEIGHSDHTVIVHSNPGGLTHGYQWTTYSNNNKQYTGNGYDVYYTNFQGFHITAYPGIHEGQWEDIATTEHPNASG